jgi:diphosphomevalonate decarboxylase
MHSATAIASPNIAMIKYWGNRNDELRIPANGSLSMTLGGLQTRTKVIFDPQLEKDHFELNGEDVSDHRLERVERHLSLFRSLAHISSFALVTSHSNFPLDVGIASSASGFAALTIAASAAAGLDLSPIQLSRIARRGSGSACRSIFGGFVEWYAAEDDEGSYAEMIAPPDHWDLVDLIALVERKAKSIGSSAGHSLAHTSPIQAARISDAPRRLNLCRDAIARKDFSHLTYIVEQDSNLMHAVMMTSTPPLLYWSPESLLIMRSVLNWRSEGLEVCYSIDAGSSVHCICTSQSCMGIEHRLRSLPGVLELIKCHPGDSARLVED